MIRAGAKELRKTGKIVYRMLVLIIMLVEPFLATATVTIRGTGSCWSRKAERAR
ncbi:MAG: hypothetical protein WD766_05530 [Gemmatimonadota bacterium]